MALDWKAGQLVLRWRPSFIAPSASPETMEQAAPVQFGILAIGEDRTIGSERPVRV